MADSPNDTPMVVEEILVTDIYPDPDFNVRGNILPGTVIDLARNIERNGLIQPITVQPFNKEGNDGIVYPFRIVVGHRRHKAFQVKEWKTIPCIVRQGLDALDAFTLNFIENVNREDLNILEEANGLSKFVKAGLTIEKIAQRTNKGRGWIQIRLSLLELPSPIQEEAAAGYITQEQIRDIRSLRTTDEQFDAVRRIKDSQIKGEKKGLKIKEVKPSDPRKVKKRNETEIGNIIEHILDTLGSCLASRVLAWANGNISDLELYMDIKEQAESEGLTYEAPIHVRPHLAMLMAAKTITSK